MPSWFTSLSRSRRATRRASRNRWAFPARAASNLSVEPLEVRALLAVFHVSLAGNDADDGSAATPFRTIQQAVTAASAYADGNDQIKVEEGTYDTAGTDVAILIAASANLTNLSLEGGYVASSTFATRDTVNNPTIYEPQGAGAAVTIGDASVTVDGFQFTFDGTADGVVVTAANVTLKDLSVTSAVDGVTASTVANLTIDGVNSSSNLGDGFSLTAMTGTLVVEDSAASTNGGVGLLVTGADSLGVTNFEADDNDSDGLRASGVTGAVTLNGVTATNHTLNDGIDLNLVGAVTATNVSASSNLRGLAIGTAASFTDTDGTYSNNLGGGIAIGTSTGDVKLVRTTADTNNFDNLGSGDGLNATSIGGSLTVEGARFRDANVGVPSQAVGVRVVAVTGAITFQNSGAQEVIVSGNSSIGVDITGIGTNVVTFVDGSYMNNGAEGILLTTVGDVTVSGGLTSTGNLTGLRVTTATKFSDTDGTYSNNRNDGIRLGTISGDVTLVRTTADNNDFDNVGGGNGVLATSITGNLKVEGARFRDTDPGAPTQGRGVDVLLLAGSATFQNSGVQEVEVTKNTLDGVRIKGNGTNIVTFVEGSYSDNLEDGIELATVKDISMTNVTVTGNDPGILVTGAATFSDTDGVYSNNADGGIVLFDITGNVTLTRTVADNNDFDGNGDGDGLRASTSLAVIAIGGDLLVRGARFRDNNATVGVLQQRGVFVQSIFGDITFENSAAQQVEATGNTQEGVKITGDGTNATVFTNGTYSNNGADGLDLTNLSSLTSSNVTANNNTAGHGLAASNINGPVTVLGGNYNGNSLNGINIVNPAASVVLDGMTAGAVGNGNGGFGFEIDTAAATLSSVTLEDLTLKENNGNLPGSVGGRIGKPVTSLLYRPSALPFNAAANDLVNLTGTQITHTRNGDLQQPINYLGATTLTISLLGGNDTINVLGEPGGMPNTNKLDIYGGSGDDYLNIREPVADASAFPATINLKGEGGNDSGGIEFGRANTATTINFDGGAASESNGLTVFTRNAGIDKVTIDGTKVVAKLNYNKIADTQTSIKTVNYTNARGVNVGAGDGNDLFEVNEQGQATFPRTVNVYGQGHNDDVEIYLGRLADATTYGVHGDAGLFNNLTFFTRNAGNDTVTLDGSKIVALVPAVKDVNYTNLAGVNIVTEGGDDRLTANEAGQASFPRTVGLFGQGDNDGIEVNLGRPSETTTYNVVGGAGTNGLALFTRSALEDTLVMNDTKIVAQLGGGAQKLLNYSNIGGASIFTAGGDDFMTLNLVNDFLPNIKFIGEGGHDMFAVKDRLGNDATITINSVDAPGRYSVGETECVQIYGFDGNDLLRNLAAAGSFMDGGDGNDTLIGGSLDDILFGGDGLDSLIGNAGPDYLFADHSGQRVLTIDSGDTLNGGSGLDTVVAFGIDTINGFTVGDTIQQDGANFDVIFWLLADFNETILNAATVEELLDEAFAEDCAQNLDFTPAA